MNTKFKIISFLSIIMLFLIACSSSNSPEPTVDYVGTTVAETLSASGFSEPTVDYVATTVAETLSAMNQGNQTPSGGGSTEPPQSATVPPPATATEPPPPQPTQSVLKVALTEDTKLWLWTEGVGSIVLYDGDTVTNVLISEDGQVVVFQTNNANYELTGLWAVNSDGSNFRRIMDSATLDVFNTDKDAVEINIYHWTFIPGTHTLAFNTHLSYMRPGLAIQDDLRLLDTDTGELTTLLDTGQAGMFYYSPDGSQIALSTPSGISLINADGTNRRNDVFVYPSVITYSEYQWYAAPRWWPDGSQLSVVIPAEDPLMPAPTFSVWNIPIDGTPASMQGSYPMGLLALFNSSDLLSPDMTKVIYLEQFGDPVNNNWELHIADLYGGGDIVFHTGDLRFVSWSPDSNWFVFEEDGDMFAGQANNTGIWPIADTPPAKDMTWIDENRFLYLSGSSGAWNLQLGSFSQPSINIGYVLVKNVYYDFSK